MLRKTISLAAALAFTAALAAAGEEAPSGEKTILTVSGMTCGACVATVKAKLKGTEGVLAYEVSLDKGEADVEYDPGNTDPEKIAASVSETGFKAKVKKEEGSEEES